MATKVYVENDGSFIRAIHEPGNATRYEMLAFRLPEGQRHKGEWLIAFPDLGVAERFVHEAPKHWQEVRDSMGRGGARLSSVDWSEMTKLVAMATDAPCIANTDKQGRHGGMDRHVADIKEELALERL